MAVGAEQIAQILESPVRRGAGRLAGFLVSERQESLTTLEK